MMFNVRNFIGAMAAAGPARTDTEIPNGDGKPDIGKRFWHIREGKYFDTAFRRAQEICVEAGVPSALWPAREECRLRLLEYPPGVGSERHTDFDLFTVNCFRSCDNAGLPDREYHVGELFELGVGQDFPPTEHHVIARNDAQFSMVFFVLPRRDARLLSGITVGKWLDERYARSRA